MEDKIQHSKPVPPFVRFCAANIPMVFDDSLSYYECLCALWKWLQTDVIDVINNNATVTQKWREELTEFEDDMTDKFDNLNDAFDTLKNWVEDYFDNLDVQQEINNKLDAMVEDGTLQEIITTYIQSNVAWTFDSVADMQASTNLIAGSFAQTLGYYNAYDGGGALYKIEDSSDTVDGGSVIDLDDLQAKLIVKNATVDIRQFGAKGDDSTDNTTAIQNAINYAQTNDYKVFIGNGTYQTDRVTITSTVHIEGVGYESVLKSIADNSNGCVIRILNIGTFKTELNCFKIDGNKTNNAGVVNGIFIHNEASSLDNDRYTFIHDLTIYDCSGDGIKLQGDNTGADFREMRFSNLEIGYNEKSGMYIDSCTDSIYYGITSHNNKEYGFYIAHGPHKFTNCKAFWNGEGDNTTLEDPSRIPASAFTATSDVTPQEGKTYYSRSGSDTNGDWYVFATFSGSVFEPDTTYYEMTTPYYKKYAGFYTYNTTGVGFVNCEAQDNRGDGWYINGATGDQYDACVADNNGFIDPETSYATAGKTQLYYGFFVKGSNRVNFNAVCKNFRTSTVGACQKAPIMAWNSFRIGGNMYTYENATNSILWEKSDGSTADYASTIRLFLNVNQFRYFCDLADLTLGIADSYFVSTDNYILRQGDTIFYKFMLRKDGGYIINDTDSHTLFRLPESFRPNENIYTQAMLSSNGGWKVEGNCALVINKNGNLIVQANDSTAYPFLICEGSFTSAI